jgi:NADH-quinone oxidoreductase subunit A
MQNVLHQYLPILIFLIIASGLAFIMIIIPFFVAKVKGDKEKLSSYECGFEAFDSPRNKFDIRFYLISILFIIFDLEIAFLFPWSIVLKEIGVFGFWSMIFFLIVLTIGFAYEWKRGALDWE